jgi:hypothetical protein
VSEKILTITDQEEFGWGITVLVLMVPLEMWRAYVTSKLWTWFALPLGAPAIGVAHFMGLFALLFMLKYTSSKTNTKSKDVVFYNITIPLLALFLGALAKAWM